PRHRRHLRRAVFADAFGNVVFLARKVWADDFTTLAAIQSLKQHVARVVERLVVHGRKEHRRSAQETILPAATASTGLGRDVLYLSRLPIVARNLAAIDDVGIERIGRDVAVLFDTDRAPIAPSDRAIIATRGDRRRTAFLLSAVDPIGPAIVSADVIHLRGRLVVPRRP